jgi:hypothetical protein
LLFLEEVSDEIMLSSNSPHADANPAFFAWKSRRTWYSRPTREIESERTLVLVANRSRNIIESIPRWSSYMADLDRDQEAKDSLNFLALKT